MTRALLFLLKVGLLVAAAVWIADRPGFVKIEWLDYTFTLHVGAFMLVVVGAIVLGIFLYRIIRTFVDFPASYRRYQEVRNQEKGYKALTLGLTAVAAGDTKAAVYQAHRARKLLDGDDGLPLLLEAQAARLEGREGDAQKSFLALLENKDAAFLGLRGLLQSAMDAQDFPHALDLARRGLKIHPKQPWILRMVYDLEIRARDWEQARKTLYRAEKSGAIAPEEAKRDRVAMLMAEAGQDLKDDRRAEALKKVKKASGVDGSFAPVVALLAKLYNQTGKKKQAVSTIEKAWKKNPHPEFLEVWDVLAPVKKPGKKSKKPVTKLGWYERLLKHNPDVAAGQVAAARAAMEESMWGEARVHFRQAEKFGPGAELYRLWADMEERAGGNKALVHDLLEKAADAKPGKTWVCSQTGRIYEEWSPIADPHGAFNTIEWEYPYGAHEDVEILTEQGRMAEALIEAPPA